LSYCRNNNLCMEYFQSSCHLLNILIMQCTYMLNNYYVDTVMSRVAEERGEMDVKYPWSGLCKKIIVSMEKNYWPWCKTNTWNIEYFGDTCQYLYSSLKKLSTVCKQVKTGFETRLNALHYYILFLFDNVTNIF
jgi:hypothetical protein